MRCAPGGRGLVPVAPTSRRMIRRARPDDVSAIGAVFLAARDDMTYLPRVGDEVRSRMGEIVTAGRDEVWVAEVDGRVEGFAAFVGTTLDHLYVRPEAQGRGIGGALFEHAKERRPEGLTFWVFQKNTGARRFYERHGCALARLTDGSGNMEQEPDALYEWRPDRR